MLSCDPLPISVTTGPCSFSPSWLPCLSQASGRHSRHVGVTRVLKHLWNLSPPHKWEYLCTSSDGTTIDPRIALKPHNKDKVYDVAVRSVQSASFHHSAFTHVACCFPADVASTSQEQVAGFIAPNPDTLAWVLWRTLFFRNFTKQLASGCSYACIPSQRPWCVVLAISPYRNERHDSPHNQLRASTFLPDFVQTVAPTTYLPSPRTLQKTPRILHGAAAVPPL
jgi:hypothetical protein